MLLPENPHQRRVAISQLVGFIGLPVAAILVLMLLLLTGLVR